MANPVPGEDDYFEIYNPNPQPVDISRFWLTERFGAPPSINCPRCRSLVSGQDAFQQFVADGVTISGADHVNFSLRADPGEALALTSSNLVAIDSLSFGTQISGVSKAGCRTALRAKCLSPPHPRPERATSCRSTTWSSTNCSRTAIRRWKTQWKFTIRPATTWTSAAGISAIRRTIFSNGAFRRAPW